MDNQQIHKFHLNLNPPTLSNKDVSWINTFSNPDAVKVFKQFTEHYYSQKQKRRFWFGINPGRHGAGVTGVAFSDPKILEEQHGIINPFPKKSELSALFIDEFINQAGGYKSFYTNNYISSVCPLGLLKNHKNYNYYDDVQTLADVKSFLIDSISEQVNWGADRSMALCIGKGKNFAILQSLNEEQRWFEKVVAVPHPRWVLQYNRKDKNLHIETYLKYVYDGS